jgi:3-oxoacyl-[acyl-carrier protein] reductase
MPFFDLTNRVALVTGGAQGIGAGIARRLAAAGARLAIFDANRDAASALALELNGLALVGDVREEATVANAVETTGTELGSVDIVVNNAGITGRAALGWEMSSDEVRSVFDVNFLGPFHFARASIPGMLRRGYGRIVNVASIAGKEGNPTLLPYSASKAALINLTKVLAKELAGKGDITVNCISPAVIRTPLLDGLPQQTIDYMVLRIPMGRTGEISEVAALVHYLASSEASFCTGQCYDISGGRATY